MAGTTRDQAPEGRTERPLRVALLHPTYWPEVRRGSERLIHDLATSLTARGHHVTLLTTHPGRCTRAAEDGFVVVRTRRAPDLRMLRKYEMFVGNIPSAAWQLHRGDFDVAHAFFQADAWAALCARRMGGPPTIFSCHGILVRPYLVERRYRVEMLKTVVREADAVTALSEAARERMHRYLLADARVLPGGVICDAFWVDVPRAAEPTIVCAASIGAPHKRGDVLMAAFERLRERRPDARLRVIRTRDPFMSKAVGDLPAGAEWIDGDDTAALAGAYASAWASVLPSVDEAFGLVLLESLAAGTPVVAARSGGPPDIVTSDRVGRLFAPDDPDDLARALGEALELGADPACAAECREHAEEYDWSRIVRRYEDLYQGVLAGRDAVVR